MKKLRNKSLFKVIFFLIINTYYNNLIIFVLSVFIFLLDNFCDLLIFMCLFFIIFVSNNYQKDFIRVGIISNIDGNYATCEKLLYKVKVKDNNYNLGDIITFSEDSIISENKYDLKNNVKFYNQSHSNVIANYYPYRFIQNRLDSIDFEAKEYIRKFIFNDYLDNSLLNVGYGFSFYYLLLLFKNKNKKLTTIILIFYILLFGFNNKFYLIIIDLLLSNIQLDKSNQLSIKIILILIINKYLLLNYSILISLLFSFYYLSEFKDNKSVFVMMESLLFGEIQLFTIFFYKYLIIIRIIFLLFSLITIFFPSFSNIYLLFIHIYSSVFNFLNISIRGKLSIFSIIILFLLRNKIAIKKDIINIVAVCVLLLLPINNPFRHISFIDVGQGDSILIKDRFNSSNILIDTGSTYNYSKLKRYLFNEGIYSIDYLIITHEDSDHSGNIDNLNNDFKILNIVKTGEDIKIGDDLELKYLDLGKYNNDNDNSLVYLLNINNKKVLLTGDISKNVEKRLINSNIGDIDILKVSHHGSNSASSNYFVGKTLPEYAVISTSGAYGHPSKEVIATLNNYLVNTFITKDSGTITFYFTYLIDFMKNGLNEFVII